ncbi:S49 family peptidase [Methylobacterium sp. NI91]|nr:MULTISPECIES: S49 family peptidase [unclassified Methylobacterium]QIJ75067.1 S49 family peptidase [Methylobacterium sp. CLZ]QIJ79971.1 S49 family peptidase [Methylobacterium sp. NI91]
MSIDRVFAAACRQPLAILPSKIDEISAFLELRSKGVRFTPNEIQARVGSGRTGATASAPTSIAVIPVIGIISHRAPLINDMSSGGGTSTQQVGAALRAALADPAVGSIVLDVDSPGGSVNGVPELADEIFAGRRKKPIIAQVNALAASAAYWIGAAASEVVMTPSGEVGSIGVYMMHRDVSVAAAADGLKITFVSSTDSPFKVEGNPYEPLSDEARRHLQVEVDRYMGDFLSAVARGRGVSAAKVKSDFGQGRTVGARDAVRLGMADRIATLRQTLTRLSSSTPAARSPSASSAFAASPRDQLRVERQIFRMVTSDDPAERLKGQRLRLEMQNR